MKKDKGVMPIFTIIGVGNNLRLVISVLVFILSDLEKNVLKISKKKAVILC